MLDGGTLGRHELPALLDKYLDLFLQAEVTTQEELEEKILRRLTQLGFALDSNGTYRFLPPMHRFLDVCLTVQQDRDLAAGLHASDLPLPAPTLASDEDGSEQEGADADDEEAALARAIAEEREFDL